MNGNSSFIIKYSLLISQLQPIDLLPFCLGYSPGLRFSSCVTVRSTVVTKYLHKWCPRGTFPSRPNSRPNELKPLHSVLLVIVDQCEELPTTAALLE